MGGDFIFTFKRKVDSIQREEWDEKKLQRTLDLRGKGSWYPLSYPYYRKAPRIPRADLTRSFPLCSSNWDISPKVLATSLYLAYLYSALVPRLVFLSEEVPQPICLLVKRTCTISFLDVILNCILLPELGTSSYPSGGQGYNSYS